MFSPTFLKDALERAVATFAQVLLGAGVVLDGGFFGSDNFKVAAAAAVASVLKSLVASKFGDPATASLVK